MHEPLTPPNGITIAEALALLNAGRTEDAAAILHSMTTPEERAIGQSYADEAILEDEILEQQLLGE